AMPTPRSEKTSVSWANPAIGMLAPVLSAKETPAADATVARTVVVTAATTAAATPYVQTGCRSAVGVAVGGGRGEMCAVVMSGSDSSAGAWCDPAHVQATNGLDRFRQPSRRKVDVAGCVVSTRCHSWWGQKVVTGTTGTQGGNEMTHYLLAVHGPV